MKKLTKEEFIERAKTKFPYYNFDKVVYVNNKTEIIVTCPVHGDFKIRPDCLLNGTGCPDCGGTKKMNTENFIKKANYVHNNFFTYEHTKYNKTDEEVIVTCPYHGDFKIRPNNHLQGQGCSECYKNNLKHKITKLPNAHASTKKLTNEDFLDRARKKWGDRYGFEHVLYQKSNKEVLVTCKIHGDFSVTPNHFLAGRGCPYCSKNKRLTNDEFVNRLKKINGDRYTYEKTNYKSTHEPVVVTCSEHGDFENTPSNLLKGQGCPMCKKYKLETKVFNLLKELGVEFEFQKKFDWLGRQSLDFFINNLKIAIECQGIQHYEETPYFSSNTLNERFELDNRKKCLCEHNGIKMLYYTEEKEHINNTTDLDFTHLKQFLYDALQKFGKNE